MAHEWRIPDHEYFRQEQRRGRRHAFEPLDPVFTVLVVIDVVPFFETNAHSGDVINSSNRLAEALRARGGSVAWVLPSSVDPYPELSQEFYGAETAEKYRTSGGEGPLRNRLCHNLETLETDLFVEKRGPSAFFPGHCDLHARLTARGVRTVLITGLVTNVCCEGTARDTRASGYGVIMIADGTGTVSDDVHNSTLFTIYRSFGDVRSTADALELIGRG